MKILHCADLHLGSRLYNVANSSQRRQELIASLSKMVEYACNNSISCVLIAGDVIDSNTISRNELASIASIFNKYPNIHYYMLKGNHGSSMAYDNLLGLCGDNMHTFGSKWTSYLQGECAIAGIELDSSTTNEVYSQLNMPSNCYNVVMLHGDCDSDEYGAIDVNALSTRCNYVALGHRHAYQVVAEKHNFSAVYSGVLECRGYDELAGSGFVVIDTDSNYSYVPQSIRNISQVKLDCSGVTSNSQLLDFAMASTKHIDSSNYLLLKLVGALSSDISMELFETDFTKMFFSVRIENNTTTDIDTAVIGAEDSLRGEVVRLLANSGSSDNEQALRVALLALSEEEITW